MPTISREIPERIPRFKRRVNQKNSRFSLLIKECQKYDENFETIEEDGFMLTDYGVNVRYPFPMDINESDMKIAVKNAYKIKDFVLAKANIE